MDINNYAQKDTNEIINNMHLAERRTANVIVRNAINAGCERLREMESIIFQLRDQVRGLEMDNAMLAESNELLRQQKQKEDFDYDKLVNDFWRSGDMFRKIRLERHGDKAPWYTPRLVKVRKVIDKLGLPIEVQQRTSTKDKSVIPMMILYRTDDVEYKSAQRDGHPD